MRGFFVGSLTLVVLYVALQPNAAGAAESAGNVLTGGLKRLLSGDVAGIPNRGKRMLGKKLTPGSTTTPNTPATPTTTPSGVWT